MTSSFVESGTREMRVSSEFRHGHAVREFVREAAVGCGLGGEAIGDLLLAVSEVFNNAVEHAHRFEAGREVVVRVLQAQGQLQVEVEDQGTGFRPPVAQELPAQALPTQRGLGIFLARQLVDEISFSGDTGTIVRLVKRCA